MSRHAFPENCNLQGTCRCRVYSMEKMNYRAASVVIALALPCLSFGAETKFTFHRDVEPILQARCQNCHRPGEAAPMSLLTYRDARPWAKAIKQAVLAKKMPPWSADGSVGHFKNDRRLRPEELDMLAKWADSGAAEGSLKDAPAALQFSEGWAIGKPDAILEMPVPFEIPANGVMDYQWILIPGFKEDKWVQAFEVRPGNRAVVHHVIVYSRPPAPNPRPAPQDPGAPPPRRPVPVFTFADDMDIPAGQTGGPELPPDQRKQVGPNDRPAPKTLGPSIGAY